MTSLSETYGGTVDCALWYWYEPTTGSGYGVYKDGKYFRKIKGRYNVPEDADMWSAGKLWDNDEHVENTETEYADWTVRAADGFNGATYNLIAVNGANWVSDLYSYHSDLSQDNADVPAFTITTAPA
jgi:hypothetical protein